MSPECSSSQNVVPTVVTAHKKAHAISVSNYLVQRAKVRGNGTNTRHRWKNKNPGHGTVQRVYTWRRTVALKMFTLAEWGQALLWGEGTTTGKCSQPHILSREDPGSKNVHVTSSKRRKMRRPT